MGPLVKKSKATFGGDAFLSVLDGPFACCNITCNFGQRTRQVIELGKSSLAPSRTPVRCVTTHLSRTGTAWTGVQDITSKYTNK